jgi:hypothetical protein
MAPAAAFAEVLDSWMGQAPPLTGAAATGRPQPQAQPGIATRGLYWFEGAVAVAKPVASAAARSRAAYPRLVSPAPQRPARTLSPAQFDALGQLQALGATLDSSFTDDELKAVFRALALTHHPDRHPEATAAEKARLSQTFVTVRSAYDALKTAA